MAGRHRPPVVATARRRVGVIGVAAVGAGVASMGTAQADPGGVREELSIPVPRSAPEQAPEQAPEPDPDGGVERVEHVVQPGDWLSRLAQHYGECGPDADMSTCWHGAYERNHGVIGDNPDLIFPGQVLTFERPTQETSSVPVHDGAAPMALEYTVESGDTLGGIAAKFGVSVTDLYDVNRDVVGGSPNLILPGQTLRLQGYQSAPGEAPPAPTSHAAPFDAPLDSMVITQGFKGAAHRGIDLRAPVGTPGYAVMDSTVRFAGVAQGFGYWVVLTAQVDGMTVDFVYGHMDSLMVKVDDGVRAGEQVINTGSNGITTGPHLHFEVWVGGRLKGHPVDPVGWLRAHGVNV